MSADLSAQLPEHLRERLRVIAARPLPATGALVLYWMHHAVRGHENPALDLALQAAERLGLPLLIYQGLGGRHRFNADRHHAFILQGAREAHAELAARGLRAVFHLPADPTAPAPLRQLVARAALVVTEDFPAPPFPAWTQALTRRTAAPVWTVDCACILPLALHQRRCDRAFEFRRQHAAAWPARLARPWPETRLCPPAYDGPLGFTPVDLAQADLPALIAACAIDHAIAPVATTPGGASAGYARWERFRDQALRDYHRRRNDAADPDGVSRLSAYLHHGQVSPLRIAREAAVVGGAGAEKFLDELLVWRELAHNFCHFTAAPEALTALPEWAQETLAAHADDARVRCYDLETLARAQTDDPLWNLAQRALLVHGELHNNLRMTWAKAILDWTPTPVAALATLIDLNHRYALDGSDPNSYGGLLWTLGLFDRPFTPERPVSGRLRTRPSVVHAGRLDQAAYRRQVDRPAGGGPRLTIAVIGAGLAGLAAARTLQDHGHAVQVFEKARGRGGRAATRRLQPGGLAGVPQPVDHGAQYFTARDPRFRRRVLAWAERGTVAPWRGHIGTAVDGAALARAAAAAVGASGQDHAERWVGRGGMSGLARDLAQGLTLHLQTEVAPPRRAGGRWLLTDTAGVRLGSFDRVLITAPAPQAAELLGAAPRLAAPAACVEYAPCWAVILVFAEPLALPWDGLLLETGPLRWAARDSAKPGHGGCAGSLEAWVLHAAPDWSCQYLEAAAQTVGATLLAALGTVLAAHRERPETTVGAPSGQLQAGTDLPPVLEMQAHRWRYALATAPLGTDCLWDAALGIGAAGDWCRGGRIEDAWLSGEALAGRLLAAPTISTGAAPDH
ncbi:MAG: FAD-binding protein [Chromatiaceae bacterium]|nr:MAG: FAD-binding protein [Chromatiaceae bacterium]